MAEAQRESKRYDFFISYHHEDLKLAQELAAALEKRGCSVWWDQALSEETRPWRDVVADAILESRALLLMLTQAAASREEIKKEIQFARYKKVQVIPLLVGDPQPLKGAAGLFQDISIYQQIRLPERSLGPQTVDLCIRRLEKSREAVTHPSPETTTKPEVTTPAIDLDPLSVDDRVPPQLSDFEKGVLKACHHYAGYCAKEGDWAEADRLFEDMKARRALPKRAQQFRVLSGWAGWAAWYEETRSRVRTWDELIRELERYSSTGTRSSEDLKTICPPVARHLERAFWRALDESLHGFLNHLLFGPGDDGSWSHAIERLEMLKPQLLAPVENLIENGGLPEPGDPGDVLTLVEQALIAYDATEDQSCLAVVESLADSPLPPDRARLRVLKTRYREQGQRDAAVQRFFQLLHKIAPRCGGPASAATQVLEHFELVGVTGEPAGGLDFDHDLVLLESWNAALDKLASAGTGGSKPEQVLKRLDQVATRFKGAAEHARLVRSWWETRQRLDACHARLIDGAGWHDDPEPMPDLAPVLEELRSGVAIPWMKSLEKAPRVSKNRLGQIKAWSAALELERQRAAIEGRLVDALRPLHGGAPGTALKALEATAGESPPTSPDLSPWIRLCEAFTRLQSDLESVLALEIEQTAEPRFEYQHLEMPEEQLTKLNECCAEIRESLDEARGQEPLFAAFSIPLLETIVDHLATLDRDRRLWRRIQSALDGFELGEAQGLLQELARRFGTAQEALAVVGAWLEVEKVSRRWLIRMSRQEWKAAAEQIEATRRRYEKTRGQSAAFGGTALSETLERRLAELDAEQTRCQLAIGDEKRLRQALRLLESGQQAEALGLFTQMKADLDSVRVWHQAAEAMAQLSSLLGGSTTQEQPEAVDPKTGMALAGFDLAREREHPESIHSAAKQALDLLALANAQQARFQCHLDLPARILEDVRAALDKLDLLERYLRQMTLVLKDIEDGEWESACTRLKELPEEVAGASVLRAAVKTGRGAQALLAGEPTKEQKLDELRSMDLSHPVLEPLRQQRQGLEVEARFTRMFEAATQLCERVERLGDGGDVALMEWLTTSLPADRAQLAILEEALEKSREIAPEAAIARLSEAAGANRTALLAAMGEVEEVAAALRSERHELPHNLGVAGFVRLQQLGEQTEPDILSRTIATWALLACCGPYRETLAKQFHQLLPAELRARSVRSKVRRELKRLLGDAEAAWGEISDPNAWACRWEAECFAVSRLPLKVGEGPLDWPFGPQLIRFYGLEKELAEILEGDPKKRSWYGPCAASEAMLALGKPEAALNSLPDLTDATLALAREAPGYRLLADPPETLRQDANRVRSDVWLFKLKRCRFRAETTGAEADQIARNMRECCGELLKLAAAGTDVLPRLTRTLGTIFQRLLDHFVEPQEHLGRPATVDDGRARKRCMDGVIELLEQEGGGELADFIRRLRTLRAKLLVELTDVAFDQWRQDQQRALLEEMVELTEQAVADAPNDPHTHIARAEILLLRAVKEKAISSYLEQARTNLDELKSKAADPGRGWPRGAINRVASLHRLAQGPDRGYKMWIRRRRFHQLAGERIDNREDK